MHLVRPKGESTQASHLVESQSNASGTETKRFLAGDVGKAAVLDAVVPVDIDPALAPGLIMQRLGDGAVFHERTAKLGKRIYDYLAVRLPTMSLARICSRTDFSRRPGEPRLLRGGQGSCPPARADTGWP